MSNAVSYSRFRAEFFADDVFVALIYLNSLSYSEKKYRK